MTAPVMYVIRLIVTCGIVEQLSLLTRDADHRRRQVVDDAKGIKSENGSTIDIIIV